ncbi:hypothetical protein BCR32DRAFT_296137 [Anaeromyces robustus]|uniref:Uncharacterized protein n=1 Tax=Anaeromyces robustus TaxID=1754192 RepID=A0A1Y1WTK6_9FUNG|nr:hypothetical protein BCR32DRAFT_296137 [Anaeromyces robustus]|eukprot:ORX76628.1 hypothetical protein BCR32DRAFT_296137 [Anaeromyces robustus]
MKSIIVILLFSLISFVSAEKLISRCLNPASKDTVWEFNQVQVAQWEADPNADGSTSFNIYYYQEGINVTDVRGKPFFEINIKNIKAGQVGVDLRFSTPDSGPKLQNFVKSLPEVSDRYFIRFGSDKDANYCPLTIKGGALSQQDMENIKLQQSSTSSKYVYTAFVAIIICIMTTLFNVL